MSAVQEKKDRIISVINSLPEDKLKIVEELINTIAEDKTSSAEDIYKIAVEKYHETLQKLAQ